MTLSPGTRLGPYEIVAPLGAGGMGEVYRARDTRLDRTVAIKILPEALAAYPQFRERFDPDARAIPQLDFPHLPPLPPGAGHPDAGILLLIFRGGKRWRPGSGGPKGPRLPGGEGLRRPGEGS